MEQEKQKNIKIYNFLLWFGVGLLILAGVIMILGFVYSRATMLLMISAALVIFSLLFIIVGMKKGEKQEIDYRNLFYIGIIWFAVGLPLSNYILSSLGGIIMVIGLANKKEWREPESFQKLSKDQRRYKMVLIAGLIILLIMGLAAFLLAEEVKGF